MTDYTEQEIDQMIDDILERPETVTKICRKCGAAFQVEKGRRKTLCPACFSAVRAENARGRAKLAREAQKKPGGVEQVPQSGAGIATATESSEQRATSSVACGRQLPLKGEAMGTANHSLDGPQDASATPQGKAMETAARECEALTVGKLLELLDHAPRDAVIREVTAVELRSIWELEHGQRTELYFRFRKEEER